MMHLARRLLAGALLPLASAACASRGGGADSAAAARQIPAAASAPAPAPRIPLPFRARGNEPGWSLDVGEREMVLVANYGEQKVVAPTPAPATSGDTTRWAARTQGHELLVTVIDRLCHDGMSGFPFPRTVTVRLDGRELRGCGGETAELLAGAEWTVHEVGGVGIAEGSRPTIGFGPEGRVSGRAPCNRFGGRYTLKGDELSVSGVSSTRMACAADLMQVEQRFLERLAAVRRFELRPDGTLVLSGEDGRTIVARR